jgi:predicted O-methyltransferase YrrM
MSRELWSNLDAFYIEKLHTPDPAMDRVLERNRDAGLRNISVSESQGKLLMLLEQAMRARRALEIGTLGGYGALWLAKGLPADGKVVTLEKVPGTAEIARRNIEEAGTSGRIEVRVGDALDTMRAMIEAEEEPFDLVFIDADRSQLPAYVDAAIALSHPGTAIIVDNTVRYGWVADPSETGPELDGVRTFLDRAGQDPRLDCTVIQTVSSKGHDGFAMCVVR